MNILQFALIVGKLKTVRRTGWLNHHVRNPESVAEHSFRSAILAMIFARKIHADEEKAIKMSLIHDIAEARIGDIVTRRGNKDLPNLSDKLARERQAFQEIFSLIGEEEYVALFNEFEENTTREAKLVKQVDKLELALQAYEYEKEYAIRLQDFFDDATEKIVDPPLKHVLNEILALREKNV